jgi:hypothetical protein
MKISRGEIADNESYILDDTPKNIIYFMQVDLNDFAYECNFLLSYKISCESKPFISQWLNKLNYNKMLAGKNIEISTKLLQKRRYL